MMTGFAWFCVALVALSVVCIFLGYPAIGGLGIAAGLGFAIAHVRDVRRPPSGGTAGKRVPVVPKAPQLGPGLAKELPRDDQAGDN